MNTNKSAADPCCGQGRHEAVTSLVGSLAEAYFPEFQIQDQITGPGREAVNTLTESDWVRAIHDALGPSGEPVFPMAPCPAASPAGGAPGEALGADYPQCLSAIDVHTLDAPGASFDVQAVRRDFPILSEKIRGKRLVWLDNAATTQKPRCVIDRLRCYYEHENSNVHRAAHTLAERTTDAYEEARSKIAAFLHAADPGEIVFVRGATEAINLAAHSYGLKHLSPGDEVVITMLEHHANIVPWQEVCRRTGARLLVVPVDETGQVILSEYERCVSPRTRIAAFTHVSNALGTVTPAAEMVHMAHRYGAKVLVDGAQAVAHIPVDVQELDCDFYAFSGHKVLGPMGIGVLYGKAEVLDTMEPYQSGGSMIEDVTMERTSYKKPPHRFEAGTGSIADAIALGSAVEYISRLGLVAIAAYENELLQYSIESLGRIPGLSLVGTAAHRSGILSFALSDIPADTLGKALDREGIAVRAGHHCAQPVLRRYGYENTVRASLALYNTREEIDRLTEALWRERNGSGWRH